MRIWLRISLFVMLLLPGYSFCKQAGGQGTTSSGESLESQLGRGYDALKQEKFEEAEEAFRAALALDSTLTMRARFPLAVALFEQHKNTDARREFENVRRAAGDMPGISYYLGRIDLQEQNYKTAATNLSKASAQPPFPDTAFYLGLAYLKMGLAQPAEKWLKKATVVNPSDSRAEYELAKLYRKEGRAEEAKDAFARSKEIKIKSDKLSQLKYECGQELDRGPGEQAPACEQLNDPKDADLLSALGVLYGQHGQLEKALGPLERAVQLSPQSPPMQYNLAFTYYQLKRFEEARRSLEPAVRRWPDLFSLSALYGAVLWGLDGGKAAYDALHHAHELNPKDQSTASLLYQCAMEMAARSENSGADAEALRYLQEAVSVFPPAPEPHQRMAAIYRRSGRPELAKQEEQTAAELSKSSEKHR